MPPIPPASVDPGLSQTRDQNRPSVQKGKDLYLQDSVSFANASIHCSDTVWVHLWGEGEGQRQFVIIKLRFLIKFTVIMRASSPLPHKSPGPPRRRSCNRLSAPVYPAGGSCRAPPPAVVGGKCEDYQAEGRSLSSCRLCPHLIFQLILSVHFMLRDVEVVSGVVVHRLCEADNIRDMIFPVIGAALKRRRPIKLLLLTVH